MRAVIKKGCKKYSFLIATVYFSYPLPFLVKTRGMWAILYPQLTQRTNCISKVHEARNLQLHSGVAELRPNFCDNINVRRLEAGNFFIFSTDIERSAESVLETCFDDTGILNYKKLLKNNFQKSDVLFIIGDYSGEFVIDQLFIAP